MQTPATRTRRFDSIEYEQFRDMFASAPFQVFLGRVRAEMDRTADVCEKAESDLDVRRGQGGVKALRMVLGLPAQIESEMRARK